MNRPKAVVHKHKLVLVAAFLSFVSFAPAHAEDFTFSIDPQDLSSALKLFAVQSHREIFFAPEVARGKKSKGIKGTVDDLKALKAILEGTGLNFSVTASNAILVNNSNGKIGASQAGASTTSGSAPANTGNPTRLVQSNAANSQSPSGASGPQDSQDATASSPKTEDSKGISEILVKGSRIMNVDVTRTEDDAQPYYIFDSQTIEQSGAVSLEDFLKQRLTMSTTFASPSQAPNSLFGNTTSINLRGLGTTETLILIDGRRSASVTLNGRTGQPDINGIPLAAIERIEVLPSSASAIYGGAAVGGVVNIILKKNFQGGDFRYSYDYASHGGAPISAVSGSYGFSVFGGTEVMVSGQYSDGGHLTLSDRQNLYERGINTILQNDPSYLYSSSNPFPGAATNIASADGSNLVLTNGTPLNSPITFIPPGTAAGSDLSPGLLANAGRYNLNLSPGLGPYGLSSPIDSSPLTKSAMLTIRQAITSTLDAFLEFGTATNSSSGAFPNSTSAFVLASAPTNPFQQNVIVNFPTTASSPFTTTNVTQQGTAGLIARLPAGWRGEFDFTRSRALFSYAFDQLDGTDFFLDTQSGALNPFVDTLAHPLNLSSYFAPTSGGGNSYLDDAALRASGPLGSWFGVRPTLTVGIEHRKEGYGNSDQDTIYPLEPDNTTVIRYFGESQKTDSVYSEVLIPLATPEKAVPLVRLLELQLAGRSERYSVNAGTPFAYILPVSNSIFDPPQGVSTSIHYTSTNPTFALKYTPVDELTIRTSFAKAFLPPTVGQLLPNHTPLCGAPCIPITDPVSGNTYNVDESAGGNPSLRPQTSKDWDVGLIWEPKEGVLGGLRMNIQHYEITQPNYITSETAQQIVNNPADAGRVTRDPVTGLITLVDVSPVNANLYKTAGWDTSIDYNRSTSVGLFAIHVGGTRIDFDKRQFQAGAPLGEFVGFPGDGGEARYKAAGSVVWSYRRWTVGWNTQYTGRYYQVGAPGDPTGTFTNFTDPQGGFVIPSQTYHSIFGGYAFDRSSSGLLSGMTIQFGVKNLFNMLPPFDVYNPSGFYSPYGDERLRSYWVSLRKAVGPTR